MTIGASQVGVAVRRVLRARGITIKDFAVKNGVSEPTMKRWLNGQGLLVADWVKMLNILSLSLAEIVGMIESISRDQFEYTAEQERALCRHPGLLAFYQQLRERHSVKDIMKAHRISSASATFYLRKLDQLKLIEWKDGFTFTLTNKGEPKWRKGGELASTFRRLVFSEFVASNQNYETSNLALYRLSEVDAARLRSKIAELFDFARTAENRALVPHARHKAYGLSTVFAEYQPSFLYSIPEVK